MSEDWLQSGLFQKWKKTGPDQTLKHYVVHTNPSVEVQDKKIVFGRVGRI